MNILITGVAGFIGYHSAQAFLSQGHKVIGIDNLNDYYSVKLKKDRLAQISNSSFFFEQLNLADARALQAVFGRYKITHVLHLAAQAGVRYSIDNPGAYIESNIVAYANLIELCASYKIEHFTYASSSSVYGLNTKMPFSVHQNVDHPVSLYAATKKSNELIAHTYSYIHSLPTTGLRFFTVYGPWGRPDMALFKFTERILEGRPIDVYNHGQMQRDFTYIGDIVQALLAIVPTAATASSSWDSNSPDPGTSVVPFRVYNIGNNEPSQLTHFISVLEDTLGQKAKMNMLPMQPGDVQATYADIDDLAQKFQFSPSTTLEQGIPEFVKWYRSYHNI